MHSLSLTICAKIVSLALRGLPHPVVNYFHVFYLWDSMIKFILKQTFVFLSAFFLFAILANGICFVLIDSLFAFFEYPNFPPTLTNPLYVLFPVVFACFSVPAVVLLSLQSQFSLKKRFLLLLESHAFFFFWQVFFWALFCAFTLHYAHILLQAVLGYTKGIDASLTSIYMPLVLTKLMPVFAILFLWISVRTSLFLIKDEEKKAGKENIDVTFSFTVTEVERAFNSMDCGNVFLLICVVIMFLPLDVAGFNIADYVPKLCSDSLVILVCYFQYSLVHWIRTEKRKSLLLLGIFTQCIFLGFNLYHENILYQLIFTAYFVSQIYAYVLFYRYGKQLFTAS